MSDRIDFTEEDKRKTDIIEDKPEIADDEGYEKYCFMCHRPESVTGKLIDLPNNICVCQDCMEKSFDAMNNLPFDLSQLTNTPGIHFMNMSDLEGILPKKQKVKKKKEGEPKKPIIDI